MICRSLDGGQKPEAAECYTYREACMDQVLNTQARTRERFEKGPFSTQEVGLAALKLYVPPLAAYLQKIRPPK